jgi:hypothetical protein
MIQALSRSVPVYPVLVSIVAVLSLFADSTAALPVLWRPLITGAIVAAMIQLLLAGLMRNRHLGAVFAALIVLSTFGYGELVIGASGVFVVAIVLAIRSRRPLRSLPWGQVTSFLNLAAAIAVVMVWVTVRESVSFHVGPRSAQPSAAVASPPGDAPDIYVLLLDGYPRSDTLATKFDYDNEPFLAEMSQQGFEVSRNSRSNYNLTSLTLASMFNMAYVRDVLLDPPLEPRRQYRALSAAINSGAALDELRSRGYEIVTVPSPFSLVTLYEADRVIENGGVTEFELGLLQIGALRHVLPDVQRDVLVESLRERIRFAFKTMRDLAAERSERPRFVFVHVMAPHPPYVFGADGEDREAQPCFPTDCDLWNGVHLYGNYPEPDVRDQVEFINREVSQATRDVIASSQRDPVVIVMSDHGHRFDLDDRHEMLRSFFIAHTPDHSSLFPASVTPVNLMPRLFNAYFGAALKLVHEDSYWVDDRLTETEGVLNPVQVSEAP